MGVPTPHRADQGASEYNLAVQSGREFRCGLRVEAPCVCTASRPPRSDWMVCSHLARGTSPGSRPREEGRRGRDPGAQWVGSAARSEWVSIASSTSNASPRRESGSPLRLARELRTRALPIRREAAKRGASGEGRRGKERSDGGCCAWQQIVRTKAESQRIVATRPLCRVQYPVPYSSRLQVIHRPGSGNCDRARLRWYYPCS